MVMVTLGLPKKAFTTEGKDSLFMLKAHLAC